MKLQDFKRTIFDYLDKIENRSRGAGSLLGRVGVCIPLRGNVFYKRMIHNKIGIYFNLKAKKYIKY